MFVTFFDPTHGNEVSHGKGYLRYEVRIETHYSTPTRVVEVGEGSSRTKTLEVRVSKVSRVPSSVTVLLLL